MLGPWDLHIGSAKGGGVMGSGGGPRGCALAALDRGKGGGQGSRGRSPLPGSLSLGPTRDTHWSTTRAEAGVLHVRERKGLPVTCSDVVRGLRGSRWLPDWQQRSGSHAPCLSRGSAVIANADKAIDALQSTDWTCLI